MNIMRDKTITSLLLVIASLLSLHSSAAEPEIDPDWQRYTLVLSFVDPLARLVVAGDREFTLPYNTPISNSNGQAIAIANLKSGDRVWLYLDNSVTDKGPTQARRIERIKQ